MMVGREVILTVEKGPAAPGDVVLSVGNLVVRDERGVEAVKGISFEIRAGEILGIAGVQGNGQTELVEALTGLRPITSGEINLNGKKVPALNPRFLFENGMASR
jgi:simple sugar transport system ATP-binding protein